MISSEYTVRRDTPEPNARGDRIDFASAGSGRRTENPPALAVGRVKMGTAREDCIWFDQCGYECFRRCDDFSPIDSSGEDEAFYREILMENIEEYNNMIREFLG